MKVGRAILFAAGLALFSFGVLAQPQKRRGANFADDVSLPNGFAIDYQLGITERKQIRGVSPENAGTLVKLNDNRSMRAGQGELANRLLLPLAAPILGSFLACDTAIPIFSNSP